MNTMPTASCGVTRFPLPALVLVAVTGCAVFPKPDDYRTAQALPPMAVPAGLDSNTLEPLHVVPEPVDEVTGEGGGTGAGTRDGDGVAARPAGVFDRVPLPRPIDNRGSQGVVIQSLGGERWIVVDAAPSQVWPLARDYWTSLGIIPDYENPGSGIIETSWVELGDDRENRHKYRIVIEPGLHSGNSELYVRHLSQARSDPLPAVITWPETSTSPDSERRVMDSLSQYLADRNDVYQASSASLLAGSIRAESKATLVDTESGRLLRLRVNFNRAWVQVRQALEEGGVEIAASDREQSYFSVRFTGIEENAAEPGMIGRLSSRSGRRAAAGARDFILRLREDGETVVVSAEAPGDDAPGAGRGGRDSGDDAAETRQWAADLLLLVSSNLG